MSLPARVFVGIDGGGTKTVTVLVDESGTEITRHLSGTSNPAVIGFDACIEVLIGSIRTVAAESETNLPLTGGWIGLAGFDRPGDRQRIAPALHGAITDLILSNDGELVLAELPERLGVAVIAGTGSIAFGRNATGQRERAGGWGHIFGDEGSGWALGKEGLRAIAEHIDGLGPATALTALVQEAWSLDDPSQVVSRAYDPATGKREIAVLSSLVIEAGCNDDEVANHIIGTEAGKLANQVVAVARRLGFTDALPLAMSGGLLLYVPMYRTRLRDAIQRQQPIGTLSLVLDPALSAAQAIAVDAGKRGGS
jgi:N-acetylglucosamine kinase-like BadF-type ATPase